MSFWNQFPNSDKLNIDKKLTSAIYNVNAHIHTLYSFSAFDSINHALDLARSENVKVLGINDFYSTEGYVEWANKCIEYKIFPLFNIEFVGLSQAEQEKGIRINDPNNPGRIYISGKGLAYPVNLSEPYFSQLEKVKASSNEQVKEMCAALNKHLTKVGVDIQLSFDDIINHYTMGMVRERHLAKVLRIKVFEMAANEDEIVSTFFKIFNQAEMKSDIKDHAALENEIRGILLKSGGAAFIPENPEQFLSLEQIRQIILKSGGIPTYPLLADSVNGGFTEFEEDKEKLLETLKDKGFYSVEFITNRNTTAVLEEYSKFFVSNGFLVTFGSEHNTPDLIPMELMNKSGETLTDKLKEINYNNACILAAHQYLTATTGKGYLDSDGKPTINELEYFKKLGTSLIEYFISK